MAYTLHLPDDWYDKLATMCSQLNLRFMWMCAVIMAESGWNPQAIGDGGQAFGLGQLHVDAAREAGWTGTDTKELLNPHLNIELTCKYFSKCIYWAQSLNSRLAGAYPVDEAGYIVYTEGPGTWAKNVITDQAKANLASVKNWHSELVGGGVRRETGEVIELPPAPTPTPPPPSPASDIEAKVKEYLDKWAQAALKEVDKYRQAQPWPPREEYNTALGLMLYDLATCLRGFRARIEEWLGEMSGTEIITKGG